MEVSINLRKAHVPTSEITLQVTELGDNCPQSATRWAWLSVLRVVHRGKKPKRFKFSGTPRKRFDGHNKNIEYKRQKRPYNQREKKHTSDQKKANEIISFLYRLLIWFVVAQKINHDHRKRAWRTGDNKYC